MPVFNIGKVYSASICIPVSKQPDPETGCLACGENRKTEYEQCRQNYFLKQQNEILKSQGIIESELKNNQFKELIAKQNTQIGDLIQTVEKQEQTINDVSTSLKYTKLLNNGLAIS